MFSILGDLTETSFLDLFAGSGIVGLEAASRGASPVVFVEKDRKKIPVLKKNLSFVEEETLVYSQDVFLFIKRLKMQFDTVYLDPPFAMKGKERLLKSIEDQHVLPSGGRLLLHHPKGEIYPEVLGSLSLEREKQYGGSILLFYRKG